jgi:hypothetical protein
MESLVGAGDRWGFGLIVVATTIALVSCKSGSTPQGVSDGTREMAESLRVEVVRVRTVPMATSFQNASRVAAIRASLGTMPAERRLTGVLQLAEEQLRAGDFASTIATVDSVITALRLDWSTIAAGDKPIFDLAALAWLRRGEQENCTADAAANICILPLAGAARHEQQSGARGAIARYSALATQFPEDLGSRWLLNLAYLQIGAYPDSVPAPLRIPGLRRTALGDSATFPAFTNVANVVGLGVMGLSGGVSIADFNGDGILDVFTTGWGITDPIHLFLADGHGGYTDTADRMLLPGITGGLNTIHADYDNDGDEDVIVLRGAWLGETARFPLSLLRNRGDGRFDDVTIDAGLYTVGPTNSAAFADYDLDGQLDLMIGYESQTATTGAPSHASRLFRNLGNGRFRDETRQTGLLLDAYVKGVSWGDVNDDGRPDLFASVMFGRNKLFLNALTSSGDTKFTEASKAAGVQLPMESFPTWFWDVDNDGLEDLFVGSYSLNTGAHEFVAREYLSLPLRQDVIGDVLVAESSRLFRNTTRGVFEDVTERMALGGKAIYAMGSAFGDLDNDGWLDFYVGTGNPDLRTAIPNRMFRNVGGVRFEEVTLDGGFGHLQKGHATAFADLDRDGDEDVFMVIGGAYEGDVSRSVLFANPGSPGRHSLTLEFEGRRANRAALGARVEVVVARSDGTTRSLFRTVGGTSSFGSGPTSLHIGLDSAASIREVRVRWPDRKRSNDTYRGLQRNASYRLVQGDSAVQLARPPIPFRTVGTPTLMPEMPGMMRPARQTATPSPARPVRFP